MHVFGIHECKLYMFNESVQLAAAHVSGVLFLDDSEVLVYGDKHFNMQLIDDDRGHTIAAASSVETDMRSASGATVDAATKVGQLIAQRAKAAGVSSVVFDRGGFAYHGRVAAAAEAAREAGLEF